MDGYLRRLEVGRWRNCAEISVAFRSRRFESCPVRNMPIKPENKSRYPKNWKEIRASILERAHNRCEFCGIENYAIRENGSRVVLTIAHLDHMPENCDPSNLRALCQKCHNTYDAKHRAETRSKK